MQGDLQIAPVLAQESFYRLGIGQPEPEKFVQLLHHLDANRETARMLALNLSLALAGPLHRFRGAHLLIQDVGLPDQSWSQRLGASLPTLRPGASHRSCKHVSQLAIGSPVPGSPI
jgi:hypothetical protein